MKLQLLLISFYYSLGFAFGQTYTDVALSQNVSFVESAPLTYAFGLSFYDFDEDGWDDLTFPTDSDSIIFYRNVNGSFQQIASYIIAIGQVREILWVDYDNDLDLDICISYHDQGIRLYQNDGNFNFIDITSAAGISELPFQAYGFSFADPDTDGDLDLYVGSHETPGLFYAPQSNLYYENQGDGTFIEKGQLLGIDNGQKPTFMPVWFDFNNDQNIDLAVINDKQLWSDAMYANTGNGIFVDSAILTGFANDGHNPMSLSVSDFNNDGFQDVFKTDVGSDAQFNGFALDHKLYQNNSGNFIDVAQGSGLDTNIFAWGALWVDYNNDGFEDLYIATTEGTGFESLLYRNNAGLSFELINDSINGDITSTSYCPVKGDIDNDGFYDIVVVNEMEDPDVLLNSGNENNFVKIDLVGKYSNQKGIGSTIEVYANGEHQTQTVFCGSGICAQNSQHKIFGLGTATFVDSILVTFPSGLVMTKTNLAANANYTIIEQVPQVVDFNAGMDTVFACDGDQFDIGIPGWINYNWSNGSQDSMITVQSSGWYSFEATNEAEDTFFVSNPVYYDYETVLSVVQNVDQPQCGVVFGGAAELITSPSQIVQNITWSNGVQSSVNASLAAGTYTYSILTANGCVYDGSAIIQNTPIFTTQAFTTPVSDTALGSIELFAWGGVDPYTYVLDGNTVSNPLGGLNAGTYEMVVTDSMGCSDTVSFTINDFSTASLHNLEGTVSSIYFHDGVLFVKAPQVGSVQSIDVYNMMGARVECTIDWEYSADGKTIMQPFDSLSQGIYRILVNYGTRIESTSIVVQ